MVWTTLEQSRLVEAALLVIDRNATKRRKGEFPLSPLFFLACARNEMKRVPPSDLSADFGERVLTLSIECFQLSRIPAENHVSPHFEADCQLLVVDR